MSTTPNQTPVPVQKKFWEGTNFYIVLTLFIVSLSTAFMSEDAALVTWLVEGAFAAAAAIRIAIKRYAKGSWTLDPRKWSLNTGNYISQLIILIFGAGAAGLWPAVEELIGAIAEGSFPGIVSAVFSLGTIIYYLVKGGELGPVAKTEVSVPVDA